MLNRLYYDEESCLYHGYTAQHKHSFAMGISLFMKSGADKLPENEVFHKVLKSEDEIFNEEEMKQYILDPYYKNGNFNSTLNNHPAKGAYPPSNRLEKQPPHFNDWYNGPKGPNSDGAGVAVGASGGMNKNNEASTSNSLAAILGQLIHSNSNSATNENTASSTATVNVSSSVSETVSNNTKKNNTVTFSCEWNEFPEAIIIDGVNIKETSTMKDLLTYSEDGDDSFAIDYELGLDDDKRKLFFKVKAEDGFNDINIKKSCFLKMNMVDICNLNHVHSQIMITIVDRSK